MILALLVGVVALFSTGAGGRHDWMRFHASDVPCPDDSCPGNLKWASSARQELKCDICRRRFRLKPVITLKKD